MGAPSYSSADFLSAMQALLPRGRAWARDPDAVQSQALAGLAPVYAAQLARSNYLLQDAFPAGAYELLPEWESTLGLPDPCTGPQPTVAGRRAAVVARFASAGGQSVSYLVGTAATLGYAITITEFAPFRFGQTFGLPLKGDAWASAWQVNAPLFSPTIFQFGTSGFGEPFASWQNTVLQCALGRIAPAHTTIIYSYT